MEGVTFGGKIGFHGIELVDSTPVVSDNQTIHVKLWWSARQKLDRDYSISLALLDSKGAIVAQVDGAPKAPTETPGQTSVWQPGTYYQDIRSLYLPAGLEPGDYRLVVAVYQWWDGVRLPPEKNSLWPQVGSDNNYLLVQTLKVGSPW